MAGKIDCLWIEASTLSVGIDDLEERHRQQRFRTCEEVQILDVSDGVEIRPAGIVSGNGVRQGGDIKHTTIVHLLGHGPAAEPVATAGSRGDP
ncbi:hypothetical protein [Bradyrhizobium diazoefficiens]|uniref:hypothetical protein n=1 Tax=Bradyrhizobium diazoefficiens TaxID=1355477 RepID=UPI0036F3E5DB